MTHALHAVLTLTFIPGLGPRKIKGLLEHFGAPHALAEAGVSDLLAVEGIGRKLAGSIVAARREAGAKADAELAMPSAGASHSSRWARPVTPRPWGRSTTRPRCSMSAGACPKASTVASSGCGA